MKTVSWKKLIGQDRIRQVLSAAFTGGNLGHAYLFCGEEGCGTLAAALDLAMAVLCTSDADVPCGKCESCEKISRYSHPDFNFVFPVVLQKEHRKDNGLSARGWDLLSQKACERVADPYRVVQENGVAGIPVEWVREVTASVNRGVLGDGMHVALICGIDQMNKESANSLLKTLEEPPERTLMILCSSRPHDVLPTIMSRCQVIRFGLLPQELVAEAVLGRSGGKVTADTASAIAASAQGNLAAALQIMNDPIDDALSRARSLWRIARTGRIAEAAALIDPVARDGDFSGAERILVCFLHSLRGSFLQRVPESRKYISNVFSDESGNPPDPEQAHRLTAAAEEALRGLRANGNTGIALVNFMVRISEILHG